MAQVCSQTFCDIVEKHDPGVHQFESVQITWKDRSAYDTPYHWFIPGVRLSSLDPEESNPALSEHGHYSGFAKTGDIRPGPIQPVFRASVVKDHNVFCDTATPGRMFVSARLKTAIENAGLTGVGFPSAWPLI